MELHEIANKLTGQANPVGEEAEYKIRMAKLEAKIELIEKKLLEITLLFMVYILSHFLYLFVTTYH